MPGRILIIALAIAASFLLSWLCHEWDPPSPFAYFGPAGAEPPTVKYWLAFEAARLLFPGFLAGALRLPRPLAAGAFVTMLSFVAACTFVALHYGAKPAWGPWTAVLLGHGAFGAVGAWVGRWAAGPAKPAAAGSPG